MVSFSNLASSIRLSVASLLSIVASAASFFCCSANCLALSDAWSTASIILLIPNPIAAKSAPIPVAVANPSKAERNVIVAPVAAFVATVVLSKDPLKLPKFTWPIAVFIFTPNKANL